ncbi:unnamed protein product [Choristocarpus tenellus]
MQVHSRPYPAPSTPIPNSVINTHAEAEKSFFITTSHRVLNASNQPMATGVWRDEGGKEKQVVTLVLVTRPRQVLDVCYLDLSDAQANGEEPLDLYSDIKTLFPHPDPHTWIPSRAYNFPLGGDVPRLCSQGVGGCFTHFYPGTLHALDFECPVGTPVLALAAGVVREVRQAVTAGGIHAQGLFDWNSVSVLQDDGLLAEYVHILAGSALVCPGDHVSTGQQLCASGDAGFCPTPHLHVQVQEGDGDSAPTCQFALLDKEGRAYVPVAGRWYGPQGASPNRSEALLVGMDRKGILCQQGQIDVSK